MEKIRTMAKLVALLLLQFCLVGSEAISKRDTNILFAYPSTFGGDGESMLAEIIEIPSSQINGTFNRVGEMMKGGHFIFDIILVSVSLIIDLIEFSQTDKELDAINANYDGLLDNAFPSMEELDRIDALLKGVSGSGFGREARRYQGFGSELYKFCFNTEMPEFISDALGYPALNEENYPKHDDSLPESGTGPMLSYYSEQVRDSTNDRDHYDYDDYDGYDYNGSSSGSQLEWSKLGISIASLLALSQINK